MTQIVQNRPRPFARRAESFWLQNCPECPPVAYLLRHAFPDRWVRFHSLPESKRYPEDESEMTVVLSRHNAVLNHLAQENERLVILSAGYSSSPKPVVNRNAKGTLVEKSKHWISLPMHEIEPDEYDESNHRHIWWKISAWKPGMLDSVFRLVANDRLSDIMIFSFDGGWIYHPYDGGADVILKTEVQRDQLKQKFTDWLSALPSGL